VSHAYLVSGLRTPFGRYGGALASVRADDLAAHVLRSLVESHPSVDWERLDDVIMGCANQAGEDNRNVARMAALLADLPVSVPGLTVNRLCGSGLDAVSAAARAVRAGDADLMVAGGVESMTRAPFVVPKATAAFARSAQMYDSTIGWRMVNPRMEAAHGTHSMPETAQGVASESAVERYGLTPLARAVSVVSVGVPPRTMGMGPEPATRALLDRTGLTLADIDLIELNEAFAAQSMAVLRALGLPDDAEHVNPHGGAIALGHPLGASGARLALTASPSWPTADCAAQS
jgi:acetyl-CoA acetyltransferase